MKKLLPFIGLIIILSACKKSTEAPYASQGTILGYGLGMCQTCGGLEIRINNDSTIYRVNSNASTPFNLGNNPKFPIPVDLDWKRDTTIHFANYIIITRIKLLN